MGHIFIISSMSGFMFIQHMDLHVSSLVFSTPMGSGASVLVPCFVEPQQWFYSSAFHCSAVSDCKLISE